MNNVLCSISHELRTPLSGMMTQLELATLEEEGEEGSELGKYLIPAFNCGKFLLYFVNDLVDYIAEVQEAGITLNLKPLSTRDLISEVRALFKIPFS